MEKKKNCLRAFLCVFCGLLLISLLSSRANAVIRPDSKTYLKLSVQASDGSKTGELTDANYTTVSKYSAGTKLTVTSETPMHHAYIIWDSLVPEWELHIGEEILNCGTNGFLHEYVEFPAAADSFTIVIPDGSVFNGADGSVEGGMRIADIYAFGEGELPQWVQTWQPPCEKADILMVPTHADDEHLFMGTILPVYQAERGGRVQVAYTTHHWTYSSTSKIREHERLNGLWVAGAVYYPVSAGVRDSKSEDLATAEARTDREALTLFYTRLIRQCQPLVVVTHDFKGEYGHGQHMLTAVCIQDAVARAADAAYDPESVEQYGTWNTPKLYFHLYGKKDTVIPMSVKLDAFGGKTVLQVATDAYNCHETQTSTTGFWISEEGAITNAKYGLFRSLVGDDLAKNDFLEHISEENKKILREIASTDVTEIYTVDDFKNIAVAPGAKYLLMEDLDFTGVDWKPFAFYGVLDGNGHSLLNLTITQCGEELRTSTDGNEKLYPNTVYSGLFSVAENAEIANLNLRGLKIDIAVEQDCIIGSFAGYSLRSNLENCSVNGELKLEISAANFGVGGLAGCGGDGTLRNCIADVTLICVDDDKTKDEQYLGGAYAIGMLGVYNCDVTIRGYVSERGYVHTGGLVGLYRSFPVNVVGEDCGIVGNNVKGFIRFFEDNDDRRAYCSAIIGESLRKYFTVEDNTTDFIRDEVRGDFDTILLPHNCENPQWEEVREGATDCTEFSFIRYTCAICGYTEDRSYELPVHELVLEETITEPTPEADGLGIWQCATCGKRIEAAIPMLEPEPEPEPESIPEWTEEEQSIPEEPALPETGPGLQEETVPAQPKERREESPFAVLTAVLAVLLAVVLVLPLLRQIFPRKKGRFER